MILFPSNKYEDSEIRISTLLTRISEYPVIQIGGRGSEPGPGKITTQDANWKQKAELLIENASAIVIVMHHSESTAWELSNIISNNKINKTIFLASESSSKESIEEMLKLLDFNKYKIPEDSIFGKVFWYSGDDFEINIKKLTKSNIKDKLYLLFK